MKKILYVLPVIGLMFLSACASTEEPVNDEDKSAETLYNEAYDYLNKTSYQKAAETFDKVEMVFQMGNQVQADECVFVL